MFYANVTRQCDYVNIALSGTVNVKGFAPFECKKTAPRKYLFRDYPASMNFTNNDVLLLSDPDENAVFQITFRDSPDNGGCANVTYHFELMFVDLPDVCLFFKKKNGETVC